MPTDATKCAGRRLSRLRRLAPGLEQRDRRFLRIGHHREPADIGNVARLDIDVATRRPETLGRGVDVVHTDIADPAGRGVHLLSVLRQVHQPADQPRPGREHRVVHAGHRHVLRAPAHDLAVKFFAACVSVVMSSYQTKRP